MADTEQTRPEDPKVEESKVDETKIKEPKAEDVAEASTAADDAPEADTDPKSRKVTLADLAAKGTTLYIHKNYEEAAEVFATASELQAELNGETAPENAEILFHYGRSLFKVGQSKSDVLGGAAAGEKKPASGAKPKTEEQKVTQEGVALAVSEAEQPKTEKEKDAGVPDVKKPLFQFTGDENFDDSDDEEPDGEAEPEEEDDDLGTAFEILDLARVCYNKQLDALQDEGKGKGTGEMSPKERHIKERLADTHDALAEISLENERYATITPNTPFTP